MCWQHAAFWPGQRVKLGAPSGVLGLSLFDLPELGVAVFGLRRSARLHLAESLAGLGLWETPERLAQGLEPSGVHGALSRLPCSTLLFFECVLAVEGGVKNKSIEDITLASRVERLRIFFRALRGAPEKMHV